MDKKRILRSVKYALRFLPDKAYIQLYYFLKFKRFCDFDNPQTFNEKLNWLKLYDRKPEYIDIVDKAKVKDYIASILGEQYVIPTLGVWESVDEIDFEKLPNSFVLKCTHDSAGIVFVKDKEELNIEEAKKKIKYALQQNFYYIGREWPYKNVKPRVIAEPYLMDCVHGEIRDYKFYCFDGVPRMMFVATGRLKNKLCFDFFDMEYHHLPMRQSAPNAENIPEKPKNFDLMTEFAKILSRGYPHIRVDFYEVNEKLYFGELTLYDSSGFSAFQPDKWDSTLGEWLVLPDKNI